MRERAGFGHGIAEIHGLGIGNTRGEGGVQMRADFADGESVARYFRPVERPAQNLANLFEMPVLYFALVPILLQTGSANRLQVTLAWIFVALRLLHSLIHIGPNTIRTRFRIYLASCITLAAMWLGFLADLVLRLGGKI